MPTISYNSTQYDTQLSCASLPRATPLSTPFYKDTLNSFLQDSRKVHSWRFKEWTLWQEKERLLKHKYQLGNEDFLLPKEVKWWSCLNVANHYLHQIHNHIDNKKQEVKYLVYTWFILQILSIPEKCGHWLQNNLFEYVLGLFMDSTAETTMYWKCT